MYNPKVYYFTVVLKIQKYLKVKVFIDITTVTGFLIQLFYPFIIDLYCFFSV